MSRENDSAFEQVGFNKNKALHIIQGGGAVYEVFNWEIVNGCIIGTDGQDKNSRKVFFSAGSYSVTQE